MLRKLVIAFVALALMVIASGSAAPTQAAGNTITDIAVRDGRFKTLVAALQAAGLDSVLAGSGPFTVFAPTDAAFAKLGSSTINALLANKSALTGILTYHVVGGSVPASAVVGLQAAKTVNGERVLINVVGGGVVLNGSVNVIITDIKASNGIIHVIDTVLLPPAGISSTLYLFSADTPVVPLPGGSSTGDVIKACQTFFVTQIWQNFGFVSSLNAYVDLRRARPVAATYGQNGDIAAGCAGK